MPGDHVNGTENLSYSRTYKNTPTKDNTEMVTTHADLLVIENGLRCCKYHYRLFRRQPTGADSRSLLSPPPDATSRKTRDPMSYEKDDSVSAQLNRRSRLPLTVYRAWNWLTGVFTHTNGRGWKWPTRAAVVPAPPGTTYVEPTLASPATTTTITHIEIPQQTPMIIEPTITATVDTVTQTPTLTHTPTPLYAAIPVDYAKALASSLRLDPAGNPFTQDDHDEMMPANGECNPMDSPFHQIPIRPHASTFP